MWRVIVLLVALGLWVGGIVYWSETANKGNSKRHEEFKANLLDPNAIPVLSRTQRSPEWSIGKWLGVGEMPSDCEMADEMMDANIAVKLVRRRGSFREYHLVDYVSSCRDGRERMIAEVIIPQVEKWCAFRSSDPMLAKHCDEWQTNGDTYRETIRAKIAPILARYKALTGP